MIEFNILQKTMSSRLNCLLTHATGKTQTTCMTQVTGTTQAIHA